MSSTARTLETIHLYLDEQDPTHTRWTYQAVYSDGHQDTGSHEGTSPEDDPDEAVREITVELGIDRAEAEYEITMDQEVYTAIFSE